MPGRVDGAKIEVSCPGCGHKSAKTIGWLKKHNEMTCIGCGQRIELENSQLRERFGKVDASLDKLSKALKKLGR